jgi:hypothetical protein
MHELTEGMFYGDGSSFFEGIVLVVFESIEG